MKKYKLTFYSLLSLLLTAIVSCSKFDLEQENASTTSKDESFTRADLVEYTINVETAGTLESLIKAGNYSDAQKLIITGNIAWKDVNYTGKIETLEELDLSKATYESETIEGGLWSNSTPIKKIILPDNVTCITGRNNNPPFLFSELTDIILPKNLKSIGYSAFKRCSSLTNIIIPKSVTSIDDYAFNECTSLVDITIQEGVTSIGERAFLNCRSLINITLPKSLKSIGDAAFEACSSLTNITLQEGLTSIGEKAFNECSSLTNLIIPKGVTSIGGYAFSNCVSLTDLTLQEDVKSIDYYAFNRCTSLVNITVQKGLTSIGENAFGHCSSLANVTLPEGLISIGNAAFSECTSLTNITLQEGLISIGEKAFDSCSSLTNITLPESVTSIGESAFSGCSSLTNINIPKGVTSIESHTFYYCRSLTSITIPEGVTSIGESAFNYCSTLTSLNIPESVTNIVIPVFKGCTSLQKVICNASVDIGDLDATCNLYSWLIINRPDGKLPMYGPNWKYVVINGTAESVKLPYQKKMNFIFPEELKSIKKISYTMTFDADHSSLYGIWGTIALPFTPARITHAEKGTLVPFDSEVDGALNFWLRELTAEGFKDVTQIEPNHPYLIAMPYSEKYADKYNISGDVTFSAENLTAKDFENNTPLSTEGTDYTMHASYSYMDKTDEVYVLYRSKFMNNYMPLYPFEAYLKMNTATMRSVISFGKERTATRAGVEGKRKPQINDM